MFSDNTKKTSFISSLFIKILFISNEKDFEVASVAMTSLHLNSREVSKTAINVMGALQFIQSQCRCRTDDP